MLAVRILALLCSLAAVALGLKVGSQSAQLRSSRLYMGGFGAPKPTAETAMGASFSPASPCPCGSGAAFEACCKPFHDGVATPPVPAKQVRARFTSLALGNTEYMLKSTHPEHKDYVPEEREGKRSNWLRSTQTYSKTHKFLTLKFDDPSDLKTPETAPTDSVAYVSFVAQLQRVGSNKIENLQETSKFIRTEDGTWLYADGKFTSSSKDMEIIRPVNTKMMKTKKIGVTEGN
jgi:SEC-C motif-containing protein